MGDCSEILHLDRHHGIPYEAVILQWVDGTFTVDRINVPGIALRRSQQRRHPSLEAAKSAAADVARLIIED